MHPPRRQRTIRLPWRGYNGHRGPDCRVLTPADLSACMEIAAPLHPAWTGPVLMFPAEEAGHIVRARLQSIASAAGAPFEALDIAVIDVPALRLDHRADRQRLVETVERIRKVLTAALSVGPAGTIGPLTWHYLFGLICCRDRSAHQRG